MQGRCKGRCVKVEGPSDCDLNLKVARLQSEHACYCHGLNGCNVRAACLIAERGNCEASFISRIISKKMLWPWYAKMKEEKEASVDGGRSQWGTVGGTACDAGEL